MQFAPSAFGTGYLGGMDFGGAAGPAVEIPPIPTPGPTPTPGPCPEWLVITGVGNYSSRNMGPAAGSHTGVCTITMTDDAQFVVAHSVAEAVNKADFHAIAAILPIDGACTPTYVSFDVPGSVTPVVLDIRRIQAIA